MQLGLHALGIGAGANRAVIDAVAYGCGRLWFPPDRPETVIGWLSALADRWMPALA